MSGVEVAGLALSFLPMFSKAFSVYASLLDVVKSNPSYDVTLQRMRILVQRARFESWVQQMSKLECVPDEKTSTLIKLAKYQWEAEIEGLGRPLQRQEGVSSSSFRKIKWALADKERISDAINRLELLNNTLWTFLQTTGLREAKRIPKVFKRGVDDIEIWDTLTPRATSGILMEPVIHRSDTNTNSPLLPENATPPRISVLHSPVEIEQNDRGKPDQGDSHTDGTLLQTLVKSCGDMLKLLANSSYNSEELNEASNAYQLWENAIESEQLYSAITRPIDSARDRSLHNLLEVHYVALLHLWSLIVEAERASRASEKTELFEKARELHDALDQARARCPRLEVLDISDFPELEQNPEKLRCFLISEVCGVVNTVRNCLPSTISFARSNSGSYESLAPDRPADFIGEMLDMSVDLILPASNALDSVRKAVTVDKRNNDSINYDDIYAVFEKEAAVLKEWKEKHRKDIEARLATRNPAKLETIAEAVVNIIHVLNSIPALATPKSANKILSTEAQGLLSEYSNQHPHLELPSKIPRPRAIDSAVQSFETCVKSLVELEETLKLVDPPPPYSKAKDSMVMDMAGRVFTFPGLVDQVA